MKLLSLAILLLSSLPALAQFGAQAVSAGRWEPRNYATSLGLFMSQCTYWTNGILLSGPGVSEWPDRSWVAGRRENLLVRSQTFETTWTTNKIASFQATDTAGSGSFANTTRTTDPLGGNTADFIQEDGTAASTHYLNQTVTLTAGTYTFTVYAKYAGRSWLALQLTSTSDGSGFRSHFNVQLGANGTAQNVVSGTGAVNLAPEAIGDGWYRFGVTGTLPGSGTHVAFLTFAEADNDRTFDGDGTSGLFLYGASLRRSTSSSEYVATTTVAEDALRSLLQGTAASQPVLSRNDNKANLLVQSEEFDATGWSVARASIDDQADTGPFGDGQADKIIEDGTAANSHAVLTSNGPPLTPGTYILSFWAKEGERTWMRPTVAWGSGYLRQHIDLANHVSGTLAVSGITLNSVTPTAAANGYYHWSISFTGSSAAATTISFFLAAVDGDIAYNGDGTSGAYIYGASLRPASCDSDYIATTATPAYPGLAVGGVYKPVLVFDGSNDSMATGAMASMVQPTVVIWGGRQVTWTDGDRMWDGANDASMLVSQRVITPGLRMSGGSSLDYNTGVPIGQWTVLSAVYNGASSSLSIDKAIVASGNAGTSSGGGVIIGGRTGTYANHETFGLIVMTNISAAATNYARLGFLGMAGTK